MIKEQSYLFPGNRRSYQQVRWPHGSKPHQVQFTGGTRPIRTKELLALLRAMALRIISAVWLPCTTYPSASAALGPSTLQCDSRFSLVYTWLVSFCLTRSQLYHVELLALQWYLIIGCNGPGDQAAIQKPPFSLLVPRYSRCDNGNIDCRQCAS